MFCSASSPAAEGISVAGNEVARSHSGLRAGRPLEGAVALRSSTINA